MDLAANKAGFCVRLLFPLVVGAIELVVATESLYVMSIQRLKQTAGRECIFDVDSLLMPKENAFICRSRFV